MSNRILRVLVFNDSPAVLDTLTKWLEIHGHITRALRLAEHRDGYGGIVDLIRSYRPDAIVFDVGLSYIANWDLLDVLRETPALKPFPFVVTTPNRAVLDKLAGEPTNAIELVGREDDLAEILRAVETAASQAEPV
jgi:CheY-like chemotaxis protein